MTLWKKEIGWGLSLAVLSGLIIWLSRDHIDDWIGLLSHFSDSLLAIPVAIIVFLIGSILLVPQWVLIATSVAAFGLVEGMSLAWVATMASATLHVLTARALETRMRARLSGDRRDKLRALFKRNSFSAGFVVRLIPSGPAIFVNAAAGLFGVSRGGFLLGTSLGIIPKIVLTGIVASELISSAQGQRISLWLALGAAGFLVLFGVSRALIRKADGEL